MTKQETLHDLIDSAVSRRKFAKSAIAAGFAIGAAGLIDGATSEAEAQNLTATDVAVLQFALNLEYLEAEFYTVITSGVTINQAPHNIPISGIGNQGPTTGAGRLDFGGDRVLEQLANELAYDERQHVLLFRQVLGSAAIAKPTIDFAPGAVTTIARFLQAARVFEDAGITAYGGAAPLLSKDVLAIAARVALAEGLHTGAIRLQLLQRGIPDLGPVDDVDIVVGAPPQIGSRLISTDAQGLTAIRTPGQVLSIVFGPRAPSGTRRGLFFPNGVNGPINSV
ncbi:MAG TPA: ferritin-like domain-containing protein [Vicinamibacterales bacterium]|nr:ferritin-like domain-containing protein [Vicinamibacterales bacterium]